MLRNKIKNLEFIKNRLDSVLPVLSFNQLSQRRRLLSYALSLFLKLTPPRLLVQYIPKNFHALFANYYLKNLKYEKYEMLSKSSITFKPSTKFTFSMNLDYLQSMGKYDEIDYQIQCALTLNGIQNGTFEACLGWAFWNYSHSDYNLFLKKIAIFLLEFDLNKFNNSRYLPEHSQNLGHLSCLFLYTKFYENHSERKIHLLKNKADNKFYLDLIKKQSKLEIIEVDKDKFPNFDIDNYFNFDRLTYSFENPEKVRIESDASNSFDQRFPEWGMAYKEPITLNPREIEKGYKVFSTILKDRWFVIFHIRSPKKLDMNTGQARDANILDYRLLAEYITESGGVVIRMGDQRFPKLPNSFPAFDYAFSEIRNDFLDCWLWANCKYWVGNVNGTMLTALTFGRKRLVTNQWYWNLYGGQNDLVLPKLLLDSGKVLNIHKTLNSKFSRQMNRQILEKNNLKLRDNSELEILNGFKDLESILENSKSILQTDALMREKLMVNSNQDGIMRLAPSFVEIWGDSLVDEL